MHSGKTNILESIFMCSIGKSFRTKLDKEVINLDFNKSLIELNYNKSDRVGKVNCEIAEKKQFWVNDIKIKKLSDLLGNIHIVTFSPDDIEILKNGPNKRRKFLNMMISQIRPKYIYFLNQYLKVLEQRNIYLRQIKFDNKEENLLNVWDEKLAEYGVQIYEYRKQFIDKIINKMEVIHKNITDNQENIRIEYISDCKNKEEFFKILNNSRKIDILKGYTTKGIHRDDFNTYINDKNISIFGSQGQHRTAILTLKLSELQIIYDEIQEEPILLLDDFMSELDEKRRKNLLENVKLAQVLITCTDKLDMDNISHLYNIKNGRIKRVI